MSAVNTARSPGLRGSIEGVTDIAATWTDDERVLWAVQAAVAFYLFVYGLAESAVDAVWNRDASTAHNIVGAAITLGLSVILLILMAIVAGYFVAEAPSNGAFSNAINTVESIGGTAFILLAVALLAVPVVAIVAYFMNSGLGVFMSGGGMRR